MSMSMSIKKSMFRKNPRITCSYLARASSGPRFFVGSGYALAFSWTPYSRTILEDKKRISSPRNRSSGMSSWYNLISAWFQFETTEPHVWLKQACLGGIVENDRMTDSLLLNSKQKENWWLDRKEGCQVSRFLVQADDHSRRLLITSLVRARSCSATNWIIDGRATCNPMMGSAISISHRTLVLSDSVLVLIDRSQSLG